MGDIMRTKILMLICLSSLTGCANIGILSKYNPPPTQVNPHDVVNKASSWSSLAPSELPVTDWIGSFEDPILIGLVEEALAANKNITSSVARLDAAVARLRIARGNKFPTVDTNSRITRRETTLPFVIPTNLSTGISTTWEADLWGRIKSTIASNKSFTEASRADYAGARLSIAGQVTLGWFDLIEAQLLSELSARDLETRKRALQQTQSRFEGGVNGASDVSLAKSSMSNALALQSTREQSLLNIRRSLEILLNRYPAGKIQASEDFPSLPLLSGAGTPSDVLRRRPDLLAAENRIYAQGLQVDVARKNLLPRFSLTANGDLSSTSFSDLFDIESIALTLISNLSAPLYQGGRLRAEIVQQEAILREQLEIYAGIALVAFSEMEDGLIAEKKLSEQEAAISESLKEAMKAEERLEIRYNEGLASILQLLDAQSRRITAEGQLISARKERLSNRARLHVALGGGFETGLDQPIE